MKKLRLFLQFYSRNIFMVCLLFVIMTLSLFVTSNAVGQYRYILYAKELYQNAGLENAVYFMPHYTEQELRAGPEASNQKVGTLLPELAAFPAAEEILTTKSGSLGYSGRAGAYKIYDQPLKNAFRLNLLQGRWFTDLPDSEKDADGRYNVIAGGYLYDSVPVNSDITITLYNSGGRNEVTVHVIGKLNYPAFIPSFGHGGNKISANNFLSRADILLFEDTPAALKMLNSKSSFNPATCLFIKFSPGAAPQEKENCLNYLRKNGTYTDYNEIMQNTNELVSGQLKAKLPTPLFFLFVSTISLISVSVLIVYKKMREHTIYYLCGCSRKRSFAYMALGIGMIGILAGLLNVLFIVFYPYFSAHGIANMGYVIFDRSSIWYITAYIAAAILLATLLPYLVFRKESPIELYRRKEV